MQACSDNGKRKRVVPNRRFSVRQTASLPARPGCSDKTLIRGDSVAHEVAWHDTPDPRTLWNPPIHHKINMNDSWLYSFRFGFTAQS